MISMDDECRWSPTGPAAFHSTGLATRQVPCAVRPNEAGSRLQLG
jgi:hypothetical protein